MFRPPADWPRIEKSMRCGSDAAVASSWNFCSEQPIASYGISASGAPCWFAMLDPAAAFAHHGSPNVGPRPGETVVPSNGATASAVAGMKMAAAAKSRCERDTSRRTRTCPPSVPLVIDLSVSLRLATRGIRRVRASIRPARSRKKELCAVSRFYATPAKSEERASRTISRAITSRWTSFVPS